jgi:hypothetical protein
MTSRQCMCRYIFILIFSSLILFGSSCAYAQADTVAPDRTNAPQVKKQELAGRQLCSGADYFHPIINSFSKNQAGYEITADYDTKTEYYLVAEGGWGWSSVNYSNLSYTTKNTFLDFGFNRTVLPRDRPSDWDKMFIGLSLACADIYRSRATYTIEDSLWGTDTGSLKPPKPFPAVWAELSGGVRVELWKGLCAGWTVRGKFMLNGKSFDALSPQYIAGYGQGEKNVVFDIDMYISYAIRWKRKGVPQDAKKTAADAAKPALAPGEKSESK